jgi:type VI secretion system protein ImpJ
MKHDNRVVWSEGMFLRVQHFQQADRWTDRVIRAIANALTPFAWGVSEMEIDRQQLTIGRFAVSNVSGLMPDGTFFSAPGYTDLPKPLALEGGLKNAIVYLCLPTLQPGLQEVGKDDANSRRARYVRRRHESQDANSGSSLVADIEVARLDLKFILSNEELSGFDRVPVARVVEVRQDQSVVLDETFIASALNCAAQAPLNGVITELLGTITHRAEAIAERMLDPSLRGTAEVLDFQFLQALNRYEAIFRHHQENPGCVHPEALYRLCVQFAGELSSFTKERRRGATFPGYRHADLKGSFDPVIVDLRNSLSSVLERTAIEITLEIRRFGVRVGAISDRGLLTSAGFVLAARADMPSEALRSALPRQIKVGPVEKISELINVALPGIGVRALPVAPRQIPYRPGTSYFELDKNGPLWKQLSQSGAIALHLTGEFPAIEMELWAIKA